MYLRFFCRHDASAVCWRLCRRHRASFFPVLRLNVKMFGWSAQSWFYNCSKPAKKEDRARSSWLADILSNHEERIVAELDVQKVLSYLVYERVFSLEEYKDILSRECCRTQAASFLEQLSSKGPGAFSAFCSVLERICPHLLIPILLDYQGKVTGPALNRSKQGS